MANEGFQKELNKYLNKRNTNCLKIFTINTIISIFFMLIILYQVYHDDRIISFLLCLLEMFLVLLGSYFIIKFEHYYDDKTKHLRQTYQDIINLKTNELQKIKTNYGILTKIEIKKDVINHGKNNS